MHLMATHVDVPFVSVDSLHDTIEISSSLDDSIELRHCRSCFLFVELGSTSAIKNKSHWSRLIEVFIKPNVVSEPHSGKSDVYLPFLTLLLCKEGAVFGQVKERLSNISYIFSLEAKQ